MIPKFTHEMSLEEVILEGYYQVRNSKYIKNLKTVSGKHFDDVVIGIEYWHQFINNDDNKLTSKNLNFLLMLVVKINAFWFTIRFAY